ncbi:MAG: CPBP family intramembrane metalloprotease [Candidatus ainarchaeum sp.]|nr:CPBP family intramembrane metalloprotease [Candidatus ainarchaeum sp.]MDD3975795.1 CPBP family intramembrane metalloprotease [Candidatus ainarchaeum sp.]
MFFLIFGIENDLHLVGDIIISFPIFYIIYLFVIRVFLEEWFFRAFLTKKTGIVISSLIFGFAHFSYGSIFEIIGAFLLGLLLSYNYKKNKNIFPNYIAHLLYNFTAYALLFIV